VELSIEKGSFPKFDPVEYGNAWFVRTLPKDLIRSIKKHGVRCVTGTAIAPTGTISLLPEVVGGIEPLFTKAYRRKDRVSERVYIHPKYKELLENGEEIPEWFVDSYDLEPKDHFEMQVAVGKYVDGAVSKTINLPEGTTTDQLDSLLLEYIRDLKGVTVYVDKSREGQILNPMTESEARNYLITANNNLVEADVKCANGTCEI